MNLNKTNIKRLVAREGLIIIGIFAITIIFYNLCGVFAKYYVDNLPLESKFKLMYGFYSDDAMIIAHEKGMFQQDVIRFGLLAYPFYLTIRFIFWAIRMLKEEKEK